MNHSLGSKGDQSGSKALLECAESWAPLDPHNHPSLNNIYFLGGPEPHLATSLNLTFLTQALMLRSAFAAEGQPQPTHTLQPLMLL